MRRNQMLALISVAWLTGALAGWAIRGTPVRAAQDEWHVAPSEAPGTLFWRYSTNGEVQACASIIGGQREGEVECRRLTLVERDARPAR